jgi:anthranilate phosphoribosyltransferase
MSLKPYIETLIAGERHLTADETYNAFSLILSDDTTNPCQIASLLTLLRARRETPQEIAGMVRAMNNACHSVNCGNKKLLDIVGTGGDGADTINISTASVVLAAACGCTVAKAGNRSVSSACGSADVLEALGVKVDLNPGQVEECVDQCDIAFLFAPVNHPAMKAVAPVRKQLGVRTCFNILGPMTNAAAAQRVVIGVFQEELLELMAETLKEVGRVDHAVVIHGVGLDEISPLGPATIVEVSLYLCHEATTFHVLNERSPINHAHFALPLLPYHLTQQTIWKLCVDQKHCTRRRNQNIHNTHISIRSIKCKYTAL